MRTGLLCGKGNVFFTREPPIVAGYSPSVRAVEQLTGNFDRSWQTNRLFCRDGTHLRRREN